MYSFRARKNVNIFQVRCMAILSLCRLRVMRPDSSRMARTDERAGGWSPAKDGGDNSAIGVILLNSAPALWGHN